VVFCVGGWTVHDGLSSVNNRCLWAPFLEKISNARLRLMIKSRSIIRKKMVIISRAITILAIIPPYEGFHKSRRIKRNSRYLRLTPHPKDQLFKA